MSGYRVFLFDGKQCGLGRHARTIHIPCSTEREAIRHADEHRRGQYAELWRHDEVVKVFDPDRD